MLKVDGKWGGLGGDVIRDRQGGSWNPQLMQGYRELQTTSLPLEALYKGPQSLGFNIPVKVITDQISSVVKGT